MLKGYIDAYWVKNSNMKKSPNQNGKKFRGRWGNCWNMKKFPNCGWMCREGLGEYLEWQKNTQCRRKCYRNAVPFALRCASCSCRAGALYIQSENQPIVSKLPWLISSCLCTACRNAQIPVCREQQLRQFYNKTASEHLCVKAWMLFFVLSWTKNKKAVSTWFIDIIIKVMGILITIVLYSRMISIYLHCAVAPLPMATVTNHHMARS